MSERNRQGLRLLGIPVGGGGTTLAALKLTDKITHILETGI